MLNKKLSEIITTSIEAAIQPDLWHKTVDLMVDGFGGLVKLGNLTSAEAEVCDLLVQGLTTEQIADKRDVSKNTIRQQVKVILNKLNCNSRIDLLRLAIDTRLPLR